MKNIKLPRLYETNYKTDKNDIYYTNVFTKLGNAIDFLKHASQGHSYFFGQIYAFKTTPNDINCLEYEDEILFEIFKADY